ncbi:precorrin-3B synthase [Agrobacterium tumefaciens]|uniref:Cobalamin biosynthesis associated protein n=1 Tax=Agrobacterium tumefaciens TaxID=358 RepID=A0A2L2LFB6_AGRTU|nr:precorrin-3B synthase [Agrobacterium tumefaciens]AVH43021.1 cobalamin biosynthesis associated protein [Agrobacterium tumefaciens]NSY96922.1 precorrin-3B synthase [Agrobacterium tumefaciens]NSZ03948.1 precorrin-3B synthase [Agrobacterium tumefaciens]NSZ38252.1 precorrin-3B synthase [Agrobacterium tumefaciens]NTB03362.1 precorrin-3B synthase [Agrobacterium tumefaciens]
MMAAADPIQPFGRRGLCPALSAPMRTGDGFLSRIAFEADIDPRDMVVLCQLAERHGNGLIDITARGSLQFRGLTPESACALEKDVLALDLPLRAGLAVETSPLAGRDDAEIADGGPLAKEIRKEADRLALHEKLAAKMSVVIDGGGRLSMEDLLADIRLKAVSLDGRAVWRLLVGGAESRALNAGLVETDIAAGVVLSLLVYLAGEGPFARGRDLDHSTIKEICGDRLLDRVIVDNARAASAPLGLMMTGKDRFAIAVAPAFGQIRGCDLSHLCEAAGTLGIKALRPAPNHSLLFFGSSSACGGLLEIARAAGFITTAGDARSSIAACPGAPGCASAFLPTHELAAFASEECASLLDGSFTLHISGCGKGCAHPAPSLLTFSGTADGLAFSISGRAGDLPDGILPFQHQRTALSRLARLYEKEHKPGENAATLFARLGKQAIGAALRQDDR